MQARRLYLRKKEMPKDNRVLQLSVTMLVLLFAALSPSQLLAHAGVGIQHLNNVLAGPYRVFVWSDPEPPTVGEYHVTVALTENIEGDATGLAGAPILDAFVTVEITHVETGETLSARATHDDALNKLFYEASFAPDEGGAWSVQVRIAPAACAPTEGGDGGSSSQASDCENVQTVAYEDEILPKAFPWRALFGGLLSILLFLGAALLYWKTQPAAAPAEERDSKERDPVLEGGQS